jgi:hypothetical protein
VTELLVALCIAIAAASGAAVVLAFHARAGFEAWLAYCRQQDRPQAVQAPTAELEGRMQRLELELGSLKVERLTGRR